MSAELKNHRASEGTLRHKVVAREDRGASSRKRHLERFLWLPKSGKIEWAATVSRWRKGALA